MLKKIVVDRIFRNFAIDEHIKIKDNYDRLQQKIQDYFKKYDIKQTDKVYIIPTDLQKKMGIN
jgi:hypothetical protein